MASVAMLPPTCMVVWTGDAQQTPGGIAKGPSQIAITRRQLISRKHALRCPQTYTPHTLFQALIKMVLHLDLPVVAELETMFQLAVADLGPLWNPTEMSVHRAWISLPVYALIAPYVGISPQLMTWRECLTTLRPLLLAKRSIPHTSPAGSHLWSIGLREVNGQWIVGTHFSGGLDGLVGGYQLVIWKKPSKDFMHATGADLSFLVTWLKTLGTSRKKKSLQLLNLYYMMLWISTVAKVMFL